MTIRTAKPGCWISIRTPGERLRLLSLSQLLLAEAVEVRALCGRRRSRPGGDKGLSHLQVRIWQCQRFGSRGSGDLAVIPRRLSILPNLRAGGGKLVPAGGGKLSATCRDAAAAGGPHGRPHAGLLQPLLERVCCGRGCGPEAAHPWVAGEQVDYDHNSPEELGEAICMVERVMDIGQQNVLHRQFAVRPGRVLASRGHYFRDGEAFVEWDEAWPQASSRGVQGERKTYLGLMVLHGA